MWRCPVCETRNDEQNAQCVVCGQPRALRASPPVEPHSQAPRGDAARRKTPLREDPRPSAPPSRTPFPPRTTSPDWPAPRRIPVVRYEAPPPSREGRPIGALRVLLGLTLLVVALLVASRYWGGLHWTMPDRLAEAIPWLADAEDSAAPRPNAGTPIVDAVSSASLTVESTLSPFAASIVDAVSSASLTVEPTPPPTAASVVDAVSSATPTAEPTPREIKILQRHRGSAGRMDAGGEAWFLFTAPEDGAYCFNVLGYGGFTVSGELYPQPKHSEGDVIDFGDGTRFTLHHDFAQGEALYIRLTNLSREERGDYTLTVTPEETVAPTPEPTATRRPTRRPTPSPRRLGEGSVQTGSSSGQAKNARRALSNIGTVTLYPGDSFSFNDRVGPRTADRGFVQGLNGRGTSVVGGGVAQVASAIYMAVEDLASISIDEYVTYGDRYNQSYVSDPEDAVMVDYNQDFDFAFRYTGDGQLRMEFELRSGWLTCTVYETD